MQLDRALAGWGEEIMAVEPSAMRGFASRPHRSSAPRADMGGMMIEWDEHGMARVGNVALICIEGPLSRCAGWWSMGYDEILEAHDCAYRSDARAILQVHHSPGGYLSGMDETAQAIEAMARSYADKPLHALSADMMYSASMRLACAAAQRWTTRAGGVGSVGVIVTRDDWTEANKLAGIRVETIASGARKADGSPDVAITAAEIKAIEGRVEFHFALFATAVARACGLPEQEVRAQQAGLYLGTQAVDARLVNGVDTLAGCIARLEAMTSRLARVQIPAGPRGQQSAKGMNTMEMGMLAIALGLAADAKDQEIQTRAAALVGIDAKLREMTGKSGEAAFATIDGWREGHAANAAAQKELGEIRQREERAAYQALVKQGEESAQITPGNRAKVLERFTTSAALSAYLETAPAALPGAQTAGVTAAHKGGKGTEGSGDDKPTALTYKSKAYKDLSFSARAEWSKANPEEWKAAKAAYEKETPQ